MKRNKQKRANCSFTQYEAYPIDLLNKQSNVLDGTLSLRTFFEDDAFTKTSYIVPIACGYEDSGLPNIQDLCQFPHLFIGGDAGSGKSSFLNVILLSILLRNSPEDISLFLVDTKGEFQRYNRIPHLAIPVIKRADRAIATLYYLCEEMHNRFVGMSKLNVKNIDSYNDALQKTGKKKQPRIVFIVDEFKPLIDILPDETESLICRLAQLGRLAGIYLVISSQHITPEVFTDPLRINLHSQVAFHLASQRSSRIMLGNGEATKIQQPGKMILSRHLIHKAYTITTPYVTYSEINSVTAFFRDNYDKNYNLNILRAVKMKTSQLRKRRKRQNVHRLRRNISGNRKNHDI